VIAAISFENPLGTTKESEPRPRGGSCSLEKLTPRIRRELICNGLQRV
jgi:hypothetical protein